MSNVIPLSRRSSSRLSSGRLPVQKNPGMPPLGHGKKPSVAAAPNTASSGTPSTRLLKTRVIENVKRLYPMPHVMIKARKALADPHSDFSRLANVLQADPALAGRILKVANSALYRRQGHITSVQQAAALLGMKAVAQIVTMISQSRMLGRALMGYGLDAGILWRHSLTVAVLSELLSRGTGAGDRSEAFLGGLMHDAGKIILNPYLIEREGTRSSAFSAAGHESLDREQVLLGFDHAEIGSELCIKWQLPVLLANAIRFHHMPGLSSGNPIAYVIHLADFMAHRAKDLTEADTDWREVDAALAFLGLTPSRAFSLTSAAEENLEDLEEDTL